MLLRTAKLAGFLRILIPQIAPIVATTIGSLSLRAAVYLIGFAFGSVLGLWLPIVATLVSVTGAFNSTSTNTQCLAYRAEMARIEAVNIQRMKDYQVVYKAWYDPTYTNWQKQSAAYYLAAYAAPDPCANIYNPPCCDGCRYCSDFITPCYEQRTLAIRNAAPPAPIPPPRPTLLSYSPPSSGGCGSTTPWINCPAGKKVWLQVLWGSTSGKASDSKGCFLVAYSQDLHNTPVKVEYNPFLPLPFVTVRAASYYLVKGDKFRGLNTTEFKNLESVQGWDRGYWMAESVDTECRGWRPGWSRKVK
ncbi:hypothetical protein QUB05_30740 [Microcoleus sp. F10-C6]|uniref:hypothetical protein n=1 Tax=unclassified Microcoleus TaxID=2642155 RepID=UPI002FD07E2A